MDIAPTRNRILFALLPLAAAAPTAVADEPRSADSPPAETVSPPPPDSPFQNEIASLSRHPSEAVRRACERMQQGQGTLTQVWQVEARWLTAELRREPGAAERRALLERLLINIRHRQMLLFASSHYDPEDRTLAELTAERKAVEAALAALAKDEDRCPDSSDSAQAPPADAPEGVAVPAEPAEPDGAALAPAFSLLPTSSPASCKSSSEPASRSGFGALLTV